MVANKEDLERGVQDIVDQTIPLTILHKYLEGKESLDDSEIFEVALSIKQGVFNICSTTESLEAQLKAL
jgi:hypothetical protein